MLTVQHKVHEILHRPLLATYLTCPFPPGNTMKPHPVHIQRVTSTSQPNKLPPKMCWHEMRKVLCSCVLQRYADSSRPCARSCSCARIKHMGGSLLTRHIQHSRSQQQASASSFRAVHPVQAQGFQRLKVSFCARVVVLKRDTYYGRCTGRERDCKRCSLSRSLQTGAREPMPP